VIADSYENTTELLNSCRARYWNTACAFPFPGRALPGTGRAVVRVEIKPGDPGINMMHRNLGWLIDGRDTPTLRDTESLESE
jgi:hypothetical protein